jgi:hypothetical protein
VPLKSTGHRNTRTEPKEVKKEPMATVRAQEKQRQATARAQKKSGTRFFLPTDLYWQEKQQQICHQKGNANREPVVFFTDLN